MVELNLQLITDQRKFKKPSLSISFGMCMCNKKISCNAKSNFFFRKLEATKLEGCFYNRNMCGVILLISLFKIRGNDFITSSFIVSSATNAKFKFCQGFYSRGLLLKS